MERPREWDAQTYHRVSEPQFEWGKRVLARLPLAGDETVIDAGCGSGRLTALLAERLPGGHVVAVDHSQNMVEAARATLAPFGDRVSFRCADLETFVADAPVDAVFSTATFHWIFDHDRLFASVHASLRAGGRLVAQCGGAGNIERFHQHADAVARSAPFAASFANFAPAWNFQSADATAARLGRLGFVDVACDLEPAPTSFPDEASFRTFVRTVVLRPHLACLADAASREAYLDAVVARVAGEGRFTLDYVRLNISARR